MKGLSEEEFKVRILGESRRMSGLVYANWNKEVPAETDEAYKKINKGSHEMRPFKIPETWTRVMVFDPGLRTAAALWLAINPAGQIIGYREMYLHNSTLPEIVAWWRQAEGWLLSGEPGPGFENINYRIIDPAGFHRNVDGTVSIADRLGEEYGLFFEPGNNDKHTNIEDVRRLLMPDLSGIPQFRIFNTLNNFKYERRRYRLKGDDGSRDRDTSADRPVKRDDHLMNCLEYFASAKIAFRGMPVNIPVADMDAEEIVYPADPEERRNFEYRLRKDRMRKQREEALEDY